MILETFYFRLIIYYFLDPDQLERGISHHRILNGDGR